MYVAFVCVYVLTYLYPSAETHIHTKLMHTMDESHDLCKNLKKAQSVVYCPSSGRLGKFVAIVAVGKGHFVARVFEYLHRKKNIKIIHGKNNNKFNTEDPTLLCPFLMSIPRAMLGAYPCSPDALCVGRYCNQFMSALSAKYALACICFFFVNLRVFKIRPEEAKNIEFERHQDRSC